MKIAALVSAGYLDVLVAALGVYLFFVFLKQGVKGENELRPFWFLVAFVVIPLVGAVHFVGKWDFSPSAPWNSLENWWCVRIPPAGKGGRAGSFNLITAGLVLSLLYAGATCLTGLFSWYWRLKRKAPLLAIHKVLIKLAVVLIGAAVYLKSENVNLTPLWVGMGAASIVVGIALQEPLSNLFTGVALDIEGVFKRNHWIRVGGEDGIVGRVFDKNWRTTKLLTINDELVTIPNRVLGTETIVNYNQPARAHAHVLHVGTSYKDPPVKVKEILRTILLREPRILKNPPPQVRTVKYNDFSIDYELKFWIGDYGEGPDIKNAVMTQVWYAFNFFGIEIPFPIRTIHWKGKQHLKEEEGAITERVGDIRGFLQTLPFLNEHLKLKDFDFLAQNCFQRRYRPGEYVVFKGELGDAFFIIREGNCKVLLPDGQERVLEPGQYFGEMALLSLRPRSADVVAGDEGSVVIRIDRECMEALFKGHPDLREAIVRVRDERMEDLGLRKEEKAGERRSWFGRCGKRLKDFVIPW